MRDYKGQLQLYSQLGNGLKSKRKVTGMIFQVVASDEDGRTSDKGRKGVWGAGFCAAEWLLKPGLKPSGLGLLYRARLFSDVSTALRLSFEFQTSFLALLPAALVGEHTHSNPQETGALGSYLHCSPIIILAMSSSLSPFLHLQLESIFSPHTRC